MCRSSCCGNSKKNNLILCKPTSITKEKNVPTPPISVAEPHITNADPTGHDQPTMIIYNDFTNVALQHSSTPKYTTIKSSYSTDNSTTNIPTSTPPVPSSFGDIENYTAIAMDIGL